MKELIPEFHFTQPVLNDLIDAREKLIALLNLAQQHRVIIINLSKVNSLTADYADFFFGGAAPEFLIQGAKMNLYFRDRNESKNVFNTVMDSIHKALPKTLGGTATLH